MSFIGDLFGGLLGVDKNFASDIAASGREQAAAIRESAEREAQAARYAAQQAQSQSEQAAARQRAMDEARRLEESNQPETVEVDLEPQDDVVTDEEGRVRRRNPRDAYSMDTGATLSAGSGIRL